MQSQQFFICKQILKLYLPLFNVIGYGRVYS